MWLCEISAKEYILVDILLIGCSPAGQIKPDRQDITSTT
jgi:hypothetical protein